MKLRIHDNSVRFRLRKNDVAELAAQGRLEAQLQVRAGAALTYRLLVTDGPAIQASLTGCTLEVTLPRAAVEDWATNEVVAITGQQDDLLILVEKDFQCLHKDGSSEDAYPNPLLQVN